MSNLKKDSDMEAIKASFHFVVLILTLFYGVHIIECIVYWYKIPIYLSFQNWLGIAFVVEILIFKAQNLDDPNFTVGDRQKQNITVLSIIWLISWLLHYLF